MKSIVAMVAALLMLSGAAVISTQPPVQPPVGQGIARSITRFDVDHPDWRLLAQPRVDTTPLRFEHHVHMNPATPQMQTRLQNWMGQMQAQGIAPASMPVVRVGAEADETQWAMTCAACHESDEAGRYFKPIVFETHCSACHGLGERGGEAVPHGREAALLAPRLASAKVLADAPAPKPAAGPKPRAGPGGPRGPAGPPAAAAKAAEPSLTLDEARKQLAANVADEQEKMLRSIGQTCTKCHGRDALDPAAVRDPAIPLRWLGRSVFDHQAHAYVACADCHAAAAALDPAAHQLTDPAFATLGETWTGRTREIMIPPLANCTQCHSEAGKVDQSCVSCHIYHPRP